MESLSAHERQNSALIWKEVEFSALLCGNADKSVCLPFRPPIRSEPRERFGGSEASPGKTIVIVTRPACVYHLWRPRNYGHLRAERGRAFCRYEEEEGDTKVAY